MIKTGSSAEIKLVTEAISGWEMESPHSWYATKQVHGWFAVVMITDAPLDGKTVYGWRLYGSEADYFLKTKPAPVYKSGDFCSWHAAQVDACEFARNVRYCQPDEE